MEDLNEVEIISCVEINEMESVKTVETNSHKVEEVILDNLEDSKTPIETVEIFTSEDLSAKLQEETTVEKGDNISVFNKTFNEGLEESRNCQDFEEKQIDKQNIEVEVDSVSETLSNKIALLDCVSKTENNGNLVLGSCVNKEGTSNRIVKKIMNLSEPYTDSSQSSSSELQLSAAPFESSCSSQENNLSANRINFENVIEAQTIWKETDNSLSTSVIEIKMDVESSVPPAEQIEKISEIPVITIDDNTQPSVSETKVISSNSAETPFLAPSQPPAVQKETTTQSEIKLQTTDQQYPPQPVPLPVIPPAPRKRGRPRKQVLPNPSPLVESWGPNAQEFPSLTPQKEERKRAPRGERRQPRKRKLKDDDGPDGDNSSRKRRTSQAAPRKKRRSTYVPKKKLPPSKKKRSEIENIQNFEEETRMSASEGPTGFSSRSVGDESQGSSATTDGPARSNVNKKGRMEVGTDGCKPVTVQQIVEYYWPPPSSLPQGEKPEGLMIQEQITEYLGVKSFKRKYPSIKRRPVDMEERNYLQENGYVSENMCDMGLTAVFAADIIEIMYNDFPQKFEEYRKYTREKKAREQRALREKQAAERADMDPQKEAVESAMSWNTEFNKTRREKRASCFDLQTFTVHFPANRFKRISLGKPGHYPVALIPGQNTDYYKSYTSNELKYFPLNTVLYGPLRPNERHLQLPSGSDGSQSEIDDTSSSDDSSSSSSEETQDTEETSSTVEEESGTAAADVKNEKSAEPEEKEVIKPVKNTPKTPKGRGRGKVVNSEQKTEPKKRLGRPPKLKVATIKLKNIDAEIAEMVKEEKVDISSRVIIHTCKMCHEEESKNKNGEFESFIECAQCKGKIHPSCIDLTADMIPKISSYGWQCTDCKSCVKCGQSSNEDKMIFCDQCDRGYHIFCVGLSEVPSGNYICIVCKPGTVSGTSTAAIENGVETVEIKEEIPEEKKVKIEVENAEKCNL